MVSLQSNVIFCASAVPLSHDWLTLSSRRFIVLDLPPLHTQPSSDTLLTVLQQLTSGLNSFGPSLERIQTENISFDGLPNYLTNIISSPLDWIGNEAQKEEIWELASRRISERAGRAGELLLIMRIWDIEKSIISEEAAFVLRLQCATIHKSVTKDTSKEFIAGRPMRWMEMIILHIPRLHGITYFQQTITYRILQLLLLPIGHSPSLCRKDITKSLQVLFT